MPQLDLLEIAKNLPNAWSSTILGKMGNAQFKVLRMDGAAYPDERHSFSEVLLVLDGQLNLVIDGQTHVVKTGEAYIVPENTPHSVAQGSFGTLVILDQ